MPRAEQERVMAELAGPLRVMKIAIQTAKIAYPDYERESGTKWPDKHLDPAEAQLFAFAALRAVDGAGFDIVPKKDKPDVSETTATSLFYAVHAFERVEHNRLLLAAYR